MAVDFDWFYTRKIVNCDDLKNDNIEFASSSGGKIDILIYKGTDMLYAYGDFEGELQYSRVICDDDELICKFAVYLYNEYGICACDDRCADLGILTLLAEDVCRTEEEKHIYYEYHIYEQECRYFNTLKLPHPKELDEYLDKYQDLVNEIESRNE